jgi:uncharacterized protein (DUF1499 family)
MPWRPLAAGVIAAAAGALSACAPERPASELPTAADALALIKQGGGSNVAVTTPDADDPRLRPRIYPGKASEIARMTEQAVTPLPRWEVIAGRSGVIWLTHRTRLGFVDDVYLLLLPTGDSTVVFARSASRVGQYDFGQNRRNLRELWAALDKRMGAVGRGREQTLLREVEPGGAPRAALETHRAVLARSRPFSPTGGTSYDEQ